MHQAPTTHETQPQGDSQVDSFLDEVWRRQERRRGRRRTVAWAFLVTVVSSSVAGVVAARVYTTTHGNLSSAIATAGVAAGLPLLVAAVVHRRRRRTTLDATHRLADLHAGRGGLNASGGPEVPAATAPAPALPPPGAPASAQQAHDADRQRRRRPPRPPGRHVVSITTALLVGALVISLTASLAALVVATRRGAAVVDASRAAASADPGPAGFAEELVGTWLRAGENSLADLQPLMARPVDLTGVPSGSFDATRISTVATVTRGSNYWSVLVVVDLVQRIVDPGTHQPRWEPNGTHYYRVGVTGADGHYLATGLPGEVARPTPPPAPNLAVTSQDTPDLSDPRADTLQRFFEAFLGSSGELTRYVLPGVPSRPVDEPNRYTQIQLRTVGFDDPEASSSVTAGVTVAATNKAGNVQVLAYSLSLVKQDGRWYVKSLDGAPALTS